MNPSALIYDIEIIRGIPPRDGNREPGIEYCGGWHDFAGMGIACIVAYDYFGGCWYTYSADHLGAFYNFTQNRQHIIGFNSRAFDDQLLAANGINVKTTYDLLEQVRIAAGYPATYVKNVTPRGLDLGSLALNNLGEGKTGRGDLAPILWQQGRHQEVIDYCKNDVMLVKKLMDKVTEGTLINPLDDRVLDVARPWRSERRGVYDIAQHAQLMNPFNTALFLNPRMVNDSLDSFLEADLDRLEKACDLLKLGIAARRDALHEHD